jgi:hypothetical protein
MFVSPDEETVAKKSTASDANKSGERKMKNSFSEKFLKKSSVSRSAVL